MTNPSRTKTLPAYMRVIKLERMAVAALKYHDQMLHKEFLEETGRDDHPAYELVCDEIRKAEAEMLELRKELGL